ncbi:legumain [Halyomorpha halys]|uniref:legumain n=1 Tax=Halyomorpha halys TaxID=286706 RepID=UPI0006D521E0|nr:legumain-like [Halyomorpha halys]
MFGLKGCVLLLLVGTIAVDGEETFFTERVWAVLVAGSKQWFNYRHQADVCHAYQTLVNKGVPKDRIITLMYDDIAFNTLNPYRGKIINEPNGTNVYEGVVIDYKGNDVSVDTFRHVLLGDKEALAQIGSGRVLASGETDHVLINFVDHGGTGMLNFPSSNLYADDLKDILKKMKDKKMFDILVMYIEACNSGSMFDNIIGGSDGVLVSTAAAPDESSYAWYCENQLETCLGDLYSITWIDRIKKMTSSESLFEQFDAIRTSVLQKSHVNLYGDYRVGFYELGFNFDVKNIDSLKERSQYETENGVDSRDVPLYLAQKQYQKDKNKGGGKSQYEQIVENRHYADNLITKMMHVFTEGNLQLKRELENKILPINEDIFECYKAIINSFQNNCFKLYEHTYFLKHTYKLSNICVKKLKPEKMIQAIESICKNVNKSNTIII